MGKSWNDFFQGLVTMFEIEMNGRTIGAHYLKESFNYG